MNIALSGLSESTYGITLTQRKKVNIIVEVHPHARRVNALPHLMVV